MLEAVLFDIGDTLVHFETWRARRFVAAGTKPVHQRLVEWGFSPPPHEKYMRKIRWAFARAYLRSRITRREVPTIDMVRRAHARMGMAIDAARMDELARLCVDPFRELFHTDPMALEVVSGIHRAGLKLGIVSNTIFPAFTIDGVLDEEGLLEYFPVRVYSSDVGYMKPHPAIFRAALERLNVEPGRAIHVGDRLSRDVRGARRAGVGSVWLCKNGSSGRGRNRAGHVIRSLEELPKVLGI